MGLEHEKKHLIIGAGFSGLGVAAAFERHGLPYDQVDAEADLGGNWRSGVYETVHIISSRKTTEYADYPMPADWPDFPSAAQMLSYLRTYADHHGLRRNIAFDTRVTRVTPQSGGRWTVTLEGGEERVYGGVVVCNGHHWDKRYPEYPGTFAGEILHSKDYKNPRVLEGKRVLVIGGGNSACDIAVEAGRFARAAHISMRRGYWFIPKTMLGVPSVELMRPWMPVWMQRALAESLTKIIVGDYRKYGLQKPDHRLFDHHPTINSELLHYLRHGRVTPHPDVLRWDGDGVVFVDGARAAIDLVVAATGYNVSFPFLADGVVRSKNGVPELFGGFLPPDHKNIYFFGVGQPRYGAGPLITAGADLLCSMVETQARLQHPIGALLRAMGQEAPRTHLQDPFRLLRQMRVGKAILKRLPRLEPVLARRRSMREAPAA